MKLTEQKAIEISIERDIQGRFLKGHSGFRDNNNGMWRGNQAKYATIHEWLRLRLGVPSICSNCGTTTAKKYEWANISREYKRDKTDWLGLCTSCHHKYDESHKKMWETRRKTNEINSQTGN